MIDATVPEAAVPPFVREEFASRLANTKARMAERGIEVLLVSDPCNIYYLTGYDAWSFYVPQVLVVALELDAPVWIGRTMDAPGARLTTYLPASHVHAYPDAYVQAADRHPAEHFVRVLREYGLDSKRIAAELVSYYLGATAYLALREQLGGREVLDGSLLVNWVRTVKSPAELALMREAAEIVQNAIRIGVEAIEPGVRECDAVARIYAAQIAGTPEAGGLYTSSPPFVVPGHRSSSPHLPWSDRRYRADEVVTLELVACRRRYHTPIGRSVYLGTPPRDLATVADATVEGLTAALDAIRPGMRCEDVQAVWHATAGRHGVAKEARCGYSIGIAYPPTFGELTCSLRPGDRTELRPGMTLHLIPAIYRPGGSVVITESFYVTETGAQPFCALERRLYSKR